jgi:hypothetical protein
MIVMKKTFLITALAVITAVCFSCKKEKTKIPENLKELWGTEWQWEGTYVQNENDGDVTTIVIAVEFVNSDSIPLYIYFPSSNEVEDSREYRRDHEAIVYKGATYAKPNLFVNKYFHMGDRDITIFEPAENLFTFSEDGFLTFTDDMYGEEYENAVGEKIRLYKVK